MDVKIENWNHRATSSPIVRQSPWLKPPVSEFQYG